MGSNSSLSVSLGWLVISIDRRSRLCLDAGMALGMWEAQGRQTCKLAVRGFDHPWILAIVIVANYTKKAAGISLLAFKPAPPPTVTGGVRAWLEPSASSQASSMPRTPFETH